MGKKKLRTFEFTYRCEVKRCASVEAADIAEARKKIDAGKFDEGHDMDCQDIDDICFTAVDGDEDHMELWK